MLILGHLLESVRTGKVVLVLGAGASVGAMTPNGEAAPTSVELASRLSAKFLGGAHSGDPLSIVAELAISESDLATVQDYIRTVFEDIYPAPFHGLLPTFSWAALATTNYDLVIERAYNQCDDRAQEAVPLIKDGDRIDDKLRSPRSMMLIKLHGCITRTSDTSVPLILSVDQYLTHRFGRDRVFDHLKNLSYENTLVFVGHSLQDPDIRQLLLELGQSTSRPRYYTVTPQVSGPEVRLWADKRISTLSGTFEDFLSTLDSKLPSPFRALTVASPSQDTPISARFTVRNPGLSSECLQFLEADVDYVRRGMPMEDLNPKLFYKGFNPTWAAVDQDLDVRRDIEDTILLDAVLDEDGDRNCNLYTIKGHAGSGKSVLLQRLVWEAALTLDKLCLYLRPNGHLSFEALRELSAVIDERIYLFVDDIDEHVNQMLEILAKCRRSNVPLTVLGAARINEWNMSCENLESYVLKDFVVRYLSPKEIDRLLDLLEKHKSLYRLEQASPQERRAAFVERAGRQLLVALHEATLGKPFEDIVADEFSEIQPDDARLIYLGICFLNRYDVDVRAGIISRVYGVRFTEFRKHLFQPLEGLVFSRYDDRSRDYVYKTRHPHIAEIVVARALSNVGRKLDMYLQMVNSMNIDYNSDRRAFRRLMQGRSLLQEFSEHEMVQRVYLAARFKARDDSYLLHQMAIYEMNRPNGSLQEAHSHLAQARALAPKDPTITHSLAELQLKKAEEAGTALEFHKHIAEAQSLARVLMGPSAVVSHGFHTLAKVHIAKLRKRLDGKDEPMTEVGLIDTIKDVEDVIEQGLERFPGDSYLLSAESDLGKLLSDDVRSREALETAFHKNTHNPFIVVRFAKTLVETQRIGEAIEVYKTALESGVSNKHVHFNYAKVLLDQGGDNGTEIEYQLRRAFTDGDSNGEGQFWYARQLYVNGKVEEAQDRFRELRGFMGNPVTKRRIRGVITENGQVKRFSGRIEQLLADYAFLMRDGTADRIYLRTNNTESLMWMSLKQGMGISFAIGFNYWGATATDPCLEA